jgi:DNA-binding transcriptional LysR family regulator
MLFRQLEYFVAVAHEKHFGRAAEACYVSQPALSSSIASLERELDVSLINRGHSFEGLTPEGERLVVWAKRILAEHDAFKAEVRAVQSGVTGTLRLGVGPTVITTVALPVVAFCSAHPMARVRILSRVPSMDIYRQLREFELDAAMGYFAPELEGLEVAPLYEERYVLIASSDLIPDAGGTISWTEAAQLPLALLGTDNRLRQFIDEAFLESGSVPVPQVEADSMATLHAMVATGELASVVPSTWSRTVQASGRSRTLPLVDPEATVEISVAINAAGPGSLVARAFVAAATRPHVRDLFAATGGATSD